MTSRILKFCAASAIVFSAGAALAQTGTGSDVSGPVGGNLAGGTFAPLPVPTGNTPGGPSAPPSPSAAPTVASTAASFSSGTPVTSPATGQTIPQAAVQQVGSILSSGSPSAVAQVSAALQSSGAPPAQVAALMQALAALANVTLSSAPDAIIAAAQAFNALVQAAGPGFFTSNNGQPSAQFLAIHAALLPMVNSLGH